MEVAQMLGVASPTTVAAAIPTTAAATPPTTAEGIRPTTARGTLPMTAAVTDTKRRSRLRRNLRLLRLVEVETMGDLRRDRQDDPWRRP
jgi:hypothetical protein